MDDILHKLSGPQFIGFTAIVLGTLSGLVITLAGIIAPQWKKVRQVEAEAQLKRDLATAGFSAEEIERVIRATSSGIRRRERAASCVE